MRTWFSRSYLRLLPMCLLILMAAGCDEHDIGTNGVLDIIYAVGDVVLAILSIVL
jgi:hypothetical protein